MHIAFREHMHPRIMFNCYISFEFQLWMSRYCLYAPVFSVMHFQKFLSVCIWIEQHEYDYMNILYFLRATIFILFPRVYFYLFYFQKISTSHSHVFISLALLSKWSIDVSKYHKLFIKADDIFIYKKNCVIINLTKRCWMSLFSIY